MQRSSKSSPKDSTPPFDLGGLPRDVVDRIVASAVKGKTAANKAKIAMELGNRTVVESTLLPTAVDFGLQEGNSVKWVHLTPTKENVVSALNALKPHLKYVVAYNDWAKLMVDMKSPTSWKAYVYSKNIPHVQLNLLVDASGRVPVVTQMVFAYAEVALMPAWRGQALTEAHGPQLPELATGVRWLRDFVLPTGVMAPDAAAAQRDQVQIKANAKLPFKPAYALVLLSHASSFFPAAAARSVRMKPGSKGAKTSSG